MLPRWYFSAYVCPNFYLVKQHQIFTAIHIDLEEYQYIFCPPIVKGGKTCDSRIIFMQSFRPRKSFASLSNLEKKSGKPRYRKLARGFPLFFENYSSDESLNIQWFRITARATQKIFRKILQDGHFLPFPPTSFDDIAIYYH